MSAGEVAALVAAVAVAMGVVGLLFTLGAAIRAIGTFRRSVEDITSMTWDPLESTCRHASLSIL